MYGLRGLADSGSGMTLSAGSTASQDHIVLGLGRSALREHTEV